MTAPRYRHTDGSVVEAIQFSEADPTTHWHVNFGHPVGGALAGVYWVQCATGPVPIYDGEYVIQAPDGAGRAVIEPGEFALSYTPE